MLYIYYPSAKDYLTRFVSRLLRAVQEKDRDFYARTHRACVETLLYDLGHVGRLFDGFHIAALAAEHPVIVAYEEVEVELPVSSLLSQLAEQIDSFLDLHPRRAERPALFHEELEALRLLAKQLREKRAKLRLKVDAGNVYRLSEIVELN